MPNALSWKQLVRRLSMFGFEGPYAGGRHLFMKNGELKLHIPNKHRGDINAGLISEIVRQAGISRKEWNSKK